MEHFTREELEFLVNAALKDHGIEKPDARMWLRRYDYKDALKARLRSIYQVLKNEYTTKRELTNMSTEQQAYYEGACCRILCEMGEPLRSIYMTVLADSPQSVKFSYLKGFNTHLSELGSRSVEYPSIVKTHHQI